MNPFRILGDVSHTASKCILIWAIHSNKSAEGVSLITQVLYIVVFTTRYLDLFWVPPQVSWWNFILKNFYIWSSIYIIILMTRIYARTREREKAWRLGGYGAGASLILAPLITLIFYGWAGSRPFEMLYTFSIILESVCILPQLVLLRQTTVPTVIDSFYLLTLGSYRAFYIVNWIYRAASQEHHFDPIAAIFGVIQTAFYIDFAWVYWTRQRVKLRGGGIVDSEDLRKGWLVNKVINAGRPSSEIDEEGLPAANGHQNTPNNDEPRKPTRWGVRGVSVSADDTLEEHQQKNKGRITKDKRDGTDEEAAAILEEDDDDLFSDGEEDARPLGGQNHPVLNSDHEWGKGSRP